MASGSITHIIFDLDGTILNTLEDLACAGNHVCASHGWPTFSTDAYRHKVGNGMPKLIERIVPAEFAGDAPVLERTLAEFRAYYDLHKEDHTGAYPGIARALGRLRGAGIALAVLTNKDHGAAVPLVERHFGRDRFALVQGRIDAFPPKPAAPMTLRVLELLGADPARTLYAGDSDVDVATGHNAGMRVIGAAWGFRGREELQAAGADFIAADPAELADIALAL